MDFKEGTLCFLKPILPETKLIFYSYVTKKNENLTFLAICTQSFKFGEGGLSAQCMQALKNCTSLSFNKILQIFDPTKFSNHSASIKFQI